MRARYTSEEGSKRGDIQYIYSVRSLSAHTGVYAAYLLRLGYGRSANHRSYIEHSANAIADQPCKQQNNIKLTHFRGCDDSTHDRGTEGRDAIFGVNRKICRTKVPWLTEGNSLLSRLIAVCVMLCGLSWGSLGSDLFTNAALHHDTG